MKILHVITRLILGGAQQNTVLSCAAQVRAGHQVSLAYGPIYGPEGSLLEQAGASGAELIEIRSMRRAVLPIHDWSCYRTLRRLIRELRPDVVHTHSSKAGIVGRAAAWREHVPAVIHTIHGSPFHDEQNPLVTRLYIELERWAARRCHKLIGITRAMCDLYLKHGIGLPEQYEVVPSGIEIERFQEASKYRHSVRDELGIPAGAPVLGLVGRIDPLKGHADLVAIMPELLSKFPGLRLLFVGDGFHRARIEQQVRETVLSERVIFTGLVPLDHVPRFMAAIDVMTLPSYQEGQGRTLVEALLCGCAIVGYDVGGIGEVCIDGKTGRLVPLGDKRALSSAITELLSDSATRQRLVERGKLHALERFDQRIMVRELERIYAEAL